MLVKQYGLALRRVVVSIAAGGSLGALVVFAQQQPVPQGPPPSFRGGVDVVQLDVSVLDQQRRPVTGLQPSDFTVLEDGKPRPIVAFVPVALAEAAAPAAGQAAWVRDVAPDVTTNAVKPEGRLVVIMLDWSIRVEDQILARKIAASTVDQLGPGDLAAVVYSSGFANAGTPQNFTADRARLLDAINRPAATALHNPPRGPMHDPRNGNEVMIDDPEGFESGDCMCRVCAPEAITRIADAVRDVQGRRKIMIFIGTYFRSYESLLGTPSRPNVPGPPAALTGLVLPSTNWTTCAGRLRDAREKMLRATSLANLTIHTVDPVGIESPGNSPLGGSPIGIQERQHDLPVLADLTGGRTVMNTETPEAHLPALFGESQTYYLVAFAPADSSTNGKLHRVEVKVGRPGVSVRTRSGYVTGETGEGARKATIATEAAGVVGGVLPRTDVPLSISVAPFAVPGSPEKAAIAITLGVQPASSGRGGPVRVLSAAFDRNGRSVNSETKTLSITPRADAGGDRGYELLSRLPLKPGRYEVRVGIDGAGSPAASVYTYVDVPDFAEQPLSLSGAVLATVPGALAAPKDAFSDLFPLVPTTMRRFARTDRVSALVRVYQQADKPAQPVQVAGRITNANDQTVANDAASLTADQFSGGRGADYRISLPLARLASGDYLFVIEATQGKYSARRGVRFTVE